MKIALLCSVLLVAAPRAFAQPETVSLGQKILRACANTYQSLREFKGSSAVISQTRIQIGKGEATTMTQTANANFDFQRDQRFHVEGNDASHKAFTIDNTPLKTTTTWNVNGAMKTETPESIELAVAGFTGVAVSAPTVVPALLLKLNWGFPFVSSNGATLQRRETFGGHSCFVVTQKETAIPGTTTYWVDAKTFLLRGMRSEQSEWSFPMDMPGGNPPEVAALPPSKVLFSNAVHVFSVEKTVPNEDELAASAKGLNIPQTGDEAN